MFNVVSETLIIETDIPSDNKEAHHSIDMAEYALSLANEYGTGWVYWGLKRNYSSDNLEFWFVRRKA